MIWSWIIWILVLTFGVVVLRGAPYVPSRKNYIDQAFTKLYSLNKNDTLVDIGSGDGIVLRHASQRGAKAIGYEINPILVIISRIFSRRDANVRIVLADFWLAKLPNETTVVYIFTATPYVNKIEAKLQRETTRLAHPIRLIIYGNRLPDRTPDKSLGGYCLYTFVPLQIVKP